MNANLSWEGFTSNDFQRLCNSILLFEVSKFAFVFTAEGKDGGIDQFFNGTYKAKTGKWRFQDKFHNSGNKAQDASELRRDIVNDIKDNYQDEDFLVFITNVNLNTTKYREFIALGEAELTKTIATCEFVIWHEPNLETLIIQFPILYSWYWQKQSVLLQDFTTYFHKQLAIAKADSRYTLANEYFGRVGDLTLLNTFLQDKSISTAAIIANGGFGKTRLVVEFFKSNDVKLSNFIPVVLSPIGYNPQEFHHLLKTDRRLLILLDNAHEASDIMQSVKHIIEGFGDKHKLILTTRPTLFASINKRLPSHSKDILRVSLGKLNYDDTKNMLWGELPYLSEKNIIHLTQTSKGVPYLILELVRAIKAGKSPDSITADQAFQEGVQDIIQEACQEIEKRTGIVREKTIDLLRLTAILSPIKLTKENRDFLGQIVGLRSDKLDTLIDNLVEIGILEKFPALSIKPDPYSDAILLETLTMANSFIELVIEEDKSNLYTENILKNLSEADNIDNDKIIYIDSIIEKYVKLLDTERSPIKILQIFEFVERITPNKPAIGYYVIEKFIDHLKDDNSCLKLSQPGWHTSTFIEKIYDLIQKIFFYLVNYTSYGFENKDGLLKVAKTILQLTNNFTLLASIYKFHEWSFKHGTYNPPACIFIQNHLSDALLEILYDTPNDFDFDFCIASAKILLELEFSLEEYYEAATGKFLMDSAKCQCVFMLKK